MIRLGLTQRVDVVEAYGERRDCLDQAWIDLLEEWDYRPFPLPNTVADPRDYLDSMALDGLILTSGNDIAHLESATETAPERDLLERAALEWAIDNNVPVIGICRGLELLNDYFGGTLSTVEDHVSTVHSISFRIQTLQLPQMNELILPDEIQVNSYHNYGITSEDAADDLEVLATASDGTVEAVSHPDCPILGIMWHPERDTLSTEFDRKLFRTIFSHIHQ